MSYASDLAKLKRATAKSKRVRPAHNMACSVCGAAPAPVTRFGPRCEEHAPADEEQTNRQPACAEQSDAPHIGKRFDSVPR